MLAIILIVIYIVGIIVWMKIEKKYFPYEEGMYRPRVNGGPKVTPKIHDYNAKVRAILWPLFLCIIIAYLSVKMIDTINDKL